MTTLTKVLIGVVLALVLLAYWEGREVGIAQTELASLVKTNTLFSLREDTLRRAFRADTLRLFHSTHTVDTTLQTLIDTALVYHVDTVKVAVAVLKEAQDTIRACVQTVRTCSEGWLVADSLKLNYKEQLETLKKSQPSLVSVWIWRLAALELGRLSAGKTP